MLLLKDQNTASVLFNNLNGFKNDQNIFSKLECDNSKQRLMRGVCLGINYPRANRYIEFSLSLFANPRLYKT